MRSVLVLPLLFLVACPKSGGLGSAATPEPGTVRFQDRTIDLEPHLEGFPYADFTPLWSTDQVLFDKRGDTLQLYVGSLSQPDPAAATPVGAIDWSTRTRWDTTHVPERDLVLYAGDENNNEQINVWTLPLDGSPPQQLTHELYIYGFGVDPAAEQLAVLARRGEGPYQTCLTLQPLDGSSEARDILCDTPEMMFTWSSLAFAPDGKSLMVQVSNKGLRTHRNLARIQLDDPQLELFSNPTVARTSASPLEHWLDANTPLFIADDSGFGQIGAVDLRTGETRWITSDERDLSNAVLLDEGTSTWLVTLRSSPVADVLRVVNPATSEVVSELTLPGQASIAGTDHSGRVLLTWSGASTPFGSATVTVAEDGSLQDAPWWTLDAEDADALVHCKVEPVTFPTWDEDPATGKPRELHAFLYTPREPLAEPVARITAFYGGANRFRTSEQVWCEAGITTLSPAVRGSWGFGREFKQLNDGDLGGNEIVDLFYAARFLETKGFSPSRIGVYGGSHGGYATMRALTFPPETNGRDDSYPFAFGIAHAGFSDIVSFYEDCNIPDWVILEAGDPATEADKLHDRSPLSHVEQLNAPLLLTHGTNDSRVPYQESQQMADRCAELGRPCTVVAFEGQGHHIRGVPNQQRLWQERMAFLESVLSAEQVAE